MIEEPQESYCLFGAMTLLKRLQDVINEIEGVRKAEDIERIHDMRVATRRMRSALNLFAACFPDKSAKKWNKQMRRVTRALGAARDADVQIDFLKKFLEKLTESRHRTGVQRLLLRLRQRRDGAQDGVLKAMDELELSGVLDGMGKTMRQVRVRARMQHVDEHSPYVYQQAYLAMATRLENMLAYEIYVNQPERLEELHAMRIAAKRLRYTMEIFAPLYPDELKEILKIVRQIQTLLGDVHDCDVWVQYLPQFLEEEKARTMEYYGHTRPFSRLEAGLLFLKQERQDHRMELYREFVEFWRQLQTENPWDNLLEQISPPTPTTPDNANPDL